MAMELKTETTEKIKDQQAKERNLLFRILKIAVAVFTVLYAGYQLYSGFTAYQAAMAAEVRYGEVAREFEALKAEAAAWHEENDSKPDATTEDGTNIEYKEMYSAINAGNEVAALQNLYYQEKEMRAADRSRLNELTYSTEAWIGSGWDPARTPIRWEFVTWYDATERAYDVCWQCWHEAPSGTMYLIAMKFASFDGETQSFRMSQETYQTDFARMLEVTGAVEAGEPVQMDMTTRYMVDELMQGGGTGTIPEGDPGQSAGVLNDENDDDNGGDGYSEDIAGGPAGGGNT